MEKNKKLKVKFTFFISLFLLAAMALDSESIIPIILCSISAIWLLLFTIANTRG